MEHYANIVFLFLSTSPPSEIALFSESVFSVTTLWSTQPREAYEVGAELMEKSKPDVALVT